MYVLGSCTAVHWTLYLGRTWELSQGDYYIVYILRLLILLNARTGEDG